MMSRWFNRGRHQGPQLSTRRLCALAALLLVPAWVSAPPAARATVAGPVLSDSRARVIVKFKADASLMRQAQSANSATTAGPGRSRPLHAGEMARRHGLPLTDGRTIDRRTQVMLAAGLGSDALAARLAADPDVEYAVPDQRRRRSVLPNDPLYAASAAISPQAGQWYLRPPDATFVSAIDAQGAWDLTRGSADVTVAVLDTGVRFDHPDLAGKLLPGYDFIADLSTAGDQNARDGDATDPGDFVAARECGSAESAENSSWHGTQIAGLIGAATDNGVGMASVGWNVRVLPLRVLGKCGGFDSDILAAMLWAGGLSDNAGTNTTPARVINLSLGSSGGCTAAYRDAVTRLSNAGVVVVVSAGNGQGLAVSAPANCPGAVAVTGLRHAGSKVGFSNVGPEVALSAPGGNCVNLSGPCLYPILAATNLGATTPAGSSYTDSNNFSVGTSFSAPLVAGTAALMLSINPRLSAAEVRSLLRSTARPFPTTSSDPAVVACQAPSGQVQSECLCTTSTCGAGMLDARAAVAAAVSALPQPNITVAADSVPAGSTLSFSAGASTVGSGLTIAAYDWAITAGANLATLTSPPSAASATVATAGNGAGTFTITLTLTDSLGQRASTSRSVTVTAVRPTVQITASASSVIAGGSVSFDSTGSSAAAGRSLSSYQWSITSGGTLATISGSTSGPTASVGTSGAGSFTVQLTLTDSAGATASQTASVTVTAAPTGGTGGTGGTGAAGGGGGAVSAWWLAGLATATLWLWRLERLQGMRAVRKRRPKTGG